MGFKRMLYILLLVLAAYGVLVLLSHLMINRMMFFPPSSYRDTPEILKLETANGKKISAIYMPNPEARYTLLYSHGNAEDLGTIYAHLLSLKQFGFSVFAYDYQGYGTSEGTPGEKKVYQDIDAAYAYLTQTLHIPPRDIIIYGNSIGSGPSVDLAVRQPVGGLILQSPFVSIFRVRTHWTLLPWDPFNNLAKIGRVRCPVLLMHGEQDEIVPAWHSKRLAQSIKAPLQTLFVKGAHHNDFIYVAGMRYWEAIQKFISTLPQSGASAQPSSERL